MKKFEFSNEKKQEKTKFIGSTFYAVYKDAEFLRSSENVETILSRGHELRQSLKTVAPGEYLVVDKMWLERNTPLLIKNTSGANIPVEDCEFTYNRLTGLVAAYAYENRLRFPTIIASEAAALGLVWNNDDQAGCQLYLSAVSGTEHFPQQFRFFPLVCALRKLILQKITLPLVLKIAKIKNDDGKHMASVLMDNYVLTNELWKRFPGPSKDLRTMLSTAPTELKKVFVKSK